MERIFSKVSTLLALFLASQSVMATCEESKDGGIDIFSCSTETSCTNAGGFWDSSASSCSTSAIIINENTLPSLSPVLAVNVTDGSIIETTAQFNGGIAINSGEYQTENLSLQQNQTALIIQGSITPDSNHVGKEADILVVALHSDTNIFTDDGNCEPDKGGYYMFKQSGFSDDYCEWDARNEYYPEWDNTVVCNSDSAINGANNLRQTRDGSRAESYWSRWSGNIDGLEAFLTTTLPDGTMTFDGQNQNLPVLYADTPNYSGFVCLTFGYRLKDGTLVFNGQPIRYQVQAQ